MCACSRDRLEQLERKRERERKLREQQKEQREQKERERRAEERRKEREARREGEGARPAGDRAQLEAAGSWPSSLTSGWQSEGPGCSGQLPGPAQRRWKCTGSGGHKGSWKGSAVSVLLCVCRVCTSPSPEGGLWRQSEGQPLEPEPPPAASRALRAGGRPEAR